MAIDLLIFTEETGVSLKRTKMRKISLYIAGLVLVCLSSCDVQSQNAIGGILKQIPMGGTPTSLEIGQGLKPVSYTHLDVYKRQPKR